MTLYTTQITDLPEDLQDRITVVQGISALNQHLARLFADLLEEKASRGEMLTTICPVGPLDYRAFAQEVVRKGLTCKHLRTINMDEYLDDNDALISRDHPLSFRRFMEETFFRQLPEQSRPLPENIVETQKVLAYARRKGVTVEAEIGYVQGNEPPRRSMVGRYAIPEKPHVEPAKMRVEQAVDFVEQTGADMLAVNIGTTHGCYHLQDEIDYELLAELRNRLDIPLVQHGTGGIAKESLSRLAQTGMNKINFGEPFRFNYINYFCELADSMEHLWHPWKIMRENKDKIKMDMIELIEALGSCQQAGAIKA